ncbi:hypothetical protein Syun_011961 [Stephania yunnanensis]|uniref:Uncharacterized protein n=1 Tax=Stephania yunnanensis TaxID=152371 RepID=A0AAP0JYR1_9MAGN
MNSQAKDYDPDSFRFRSLKAISSWEWAISYAGLSAVSGLSVSSRWSPSLRLVVLPGLSAVSGLAVSLVSPSRRAGLRHRPSTLALSANTHDQELFSFHRDHSPCDGFEEVLNCYNVFAQLLRLSDEFKNFFSKHGKVVEHQIIHDHNTNRSRGTPGLGGRLGGYGGYSGGSELGGGYGGFGGSSLGAYRVMFLTLSAMYELLCVLLYAYVFGKLPIVKYYRAKAASEGARTVVADLAAGGIQTEHAKATIEGSRIKERETVRERPKDREGSRETEREEKQRAKEMSSGD